MNKLDEKILFWKLYNTNNLNSIILIMICHVRKLYNDVDFDINEKWNEY